MPSNMHETCFANDSAERVYVVAFLLAPYNNRTITAQFVADIVPRRMSYSACANASASDNWLIFPTSIIR